MKNINHHNFYPLITVVTVTFNAEKFLEQTINSIVDQDYTNIEYIIIDGKSTDKTVNIIKKYSQYINYWLSEPDKGIYNAMNKAISLASGKYINFMNAGDIFSTKNTISKVIENIDDSVDLVYGDHYLINDKNKTYIKAKAIGDFFKGIPFCHQSLFTKTSILKDNKFNESYSIAADYDFILKSYIKKFKFKYLNFSISNFLEAGLSKKLILKSSIEALNVISNYTEDISIIYKSNPFRIIENEQENHSYHFSVLLNIFYEKIKTLTNRKFVLYGYGCTGKLIYQEFKNNINIIVDQNYKLKKHSEIGIVHPSELKKLDFDFILVSVFGQEESIINYLTNELNISKEKIITIDF